MRIQILTSILVSMHFKSSFLDAIPIYTSHFFRGFAPMFDPTGSLFSMSTSGFYERFYDSSNGMDAFHNPSLFSFMTR